MTFYTNVVNQDGNRNIPYVNNDGMQFVGNWNRLDNDFNDNGRVAVSRSWQCELAVMLGGG